MLARTIRTRPPETKHDHCYLTITPGHNPKTYDQAFASQIMFIHSVGVEMHHKNDRLRARGVTLVEAVLYVSVSLGLIIGGLVFFQQASRAAGWLEVRRGVEAINAEVRAMYQITKWSFEVGPLNGSDQNISNILISMDVIPQEFLSADRTKIVMGPIEQLMVRHTQPNSRSIEIWYYFTGVPDWLCSRLIVANDNLVAQTAQGILPSIYEVYAFRNNPNRSRIHNIGRNGGLDPATAADICDEITYSGVVSNVLLKSRLAL